MSNMPNPNRAKNLKNKHRKQKRQKKLSVALLISLGTVIVVLVLLIVFVWTKKGNNHSEPETNTYNVETFIPHTSSGPGLIGSWKHDEDTTFYFDESGRGEYSYNDATYIFSYSLNDDVLNINFDDEKIKDISYKLTFFEGEEKASINVLDNSGNPSDKVYTLVKE